MKRRFSNWIGPLFLMGLGATGAYRVYRDTRLAVESEHWVACDATVDRAWLEKHHGRRGSPRYEPRVEYRYSMNGSDYVGSRLEIPMHRYAPSYARKKIAGLDPGATIRILYDPDDPAESVVETPSVDWFMIFVPGGISLLLIAGGVFALHASSKPASEAGRPRRRKERGRRRRSSTEVAQITTAD